MCSLFLAHTGATRGQLVRRKVSKLETLQFAIGYIEELEEQCRSPSGKVSGGNLDIYKVR